MVGHVETNYDVHMITLSSYAQNIFSQTCKGVTLFLLAKYNTSIFLIAKFELE